MPSDLKRTDRWAAETKYFMHHAEMNTISWLVLFRVPLGPAGEPKWHNNKRYYRVTNSDFCASLGTMIFANVPRNIIRFCVVQKYFVAANVWFALLRCDSIACPLTNYLKIRCLLLTKKLSFNKLEAKKIRFDLRLSLCL